MTRTTHGIPTPLYRLAEKCRKALLYYAYKHDWPCDLAGRCEHAAYYFACKAEEAGHKVAVCDGYYGASDHSWCRYRNKFIDLSSSQFGFCGGIEIADAEEDEDGYNSWTSTVGGCGVNVTGIDRYFGKKLPPEVDDVYRGVCFDWRKRNDVSSGRKR